MVPGGFPAASDVANAPTFSETLLYHSHIGFVSENSFHRGGIGCLLWQSVNFTRPQSGDTVQQRRSKMSTLDIIRAWKDEEYRLSLSEAERALLPANPAGAIQLEDADLDAVAGGKPKITNTYCSENSLGWRCIKNTKRCNTY
jgi:mersacidin/lichenicidin family type 2 lantibiotic